MKNFYSSIYNRKASHISGYFQILFFLKGFHIKWYFQILHEYKEVRLKNSFWLSQKHEVRTKTFTPIHLIPYLPFLGFFYGAIVELEMSSHITQSFLRFFMGWLWYLPHWQWVCRLCPFYHSSLFLVVISERIWMVTMSTCFHTRNNTFYIILLLHILLFSFSFHKILTIVV